MDQTAGKAHTAAWKWYLTSWIDKWMESQGWSAQKKMKEKKTSEMLTHILKAILLKKPQKCHSIVINCTVKKS